MEDLVRVVEGNGKGFDIDAYLSKKEARKMDPFSTKNNSQTVDFLISYLCHMFYLIIIFTKPQAYRKEEACVRSNGKKMLH